MVCLFSVQAGGLFCVSSLPCRDARVKASLLLRAHSNRESFKPAPVHSREHTDNIQTSIHSMMGRVAVVPAKTNIPRHSASRERKCVPPSVSQSSLPLPS
mmetsp:Transcript_29266/g.84650  ORF Transcript_29266/g.84650 Transcript_29266/m.84650 type:complete len:100 (-) Transcript_29266:1132-1431(-)